MPLGLSLAASETVGIPCTRGFLGRRALRHFVCMATSVSQVQPSQTTMEHPSPAPQAEKAWAFFRSIGSPKYHVAPMVDQVRISISASHIRVVGHRRLQADSRGCTGQLAFKDVSHWPSILSTHSNNETKGRSLRNYSSRCAVRAALPDALPQARQHCSLHPHATRSTVCGDCGL